MFVCFFHWVFGITRQLWAYGSRPIDASCILECLLGLWLTPGVCLCDFDFAMLVGPMAHALLVETDCFLLEHGFPMLAIDYSFVIRYVSAMLVGPMAHASFMLRTHVSFLARRSKGSSPTIPTRRTSCTSYSIKLQSCTKHVWFHIAVLRSYCRVAFSTTTRTHIRTRFRVHASRLARKHCSMWFCSFVFCSSIMHDILWLSTAPPTGFKPSEFGRSRQDTVFQLGRADIGGGGRRGGGGPLSKPKDPIRGTVAADRRAETVCSGYKTKHSVLIRFVNFEYVFMSSELLRNCFGVASEWEKFFQFVCSNVILLYRFYIKSYN